MREWSCKLLEAMDEGILDPKAIAEMAIGFMSEDDVKAMCYANQLRDVLFGEEDEEEDE